MSESLDRRLDAERVAELKEHLSGCAKCRRLYGQLHEIDAILPAWEVPPPAAGLKGRILRAAEASHSRPRRVTWGHGLLRMAAAVVAAACVAGAVFLLSRQRDIREDTGPVAAGEGQGMVVIAQAPGVPVELAQVCLKLAPMAGDAASNLTRRTASSVFSASDRLSEDAASIQRGVEAVGGLVKTRLLPSFTGGADKAIGPFEGPQEEEQGAQSDHGVRDCGRAQA